MTGMEPFLMAAGAAMSAVGAIQQGKSANAAAQYNAQLSRQNAIAKRAAAKEKATREARLGTKRMGALRAMDPNKMDLLEDSAIEEELAYQSIIHEGETGAIGDENTARLDVARGKAAQSAGYTQAAGSVLLGGAESGVFSA